jgi:AmiR/NasT family two-component response regulator
MLSLRLFTADTTVGALNLYALQPHSFSEVSHLEGGTLAAQCAVAMASADTIDNLHVAVRHRTTIGQAQGILMERFSLEPDPAFAVLTRLSQDHNEKLYDLACRIVATRNVPGRAAG